MTTNSSLDHYYNRHEKGKNWDKILFLSGLGIQAPEFNELQDIISGQIKGLGDAFFSDGHIIEGCEITIDIEGCVAKLDAGRVYIAGQVWTVQATTIRVPSDNSVQIGVRLCEKTITYHQDGSLRDPSEGCPNYNKPGAARLAKWAEWGINTDTMLEGALYPIYTINNLIVVNKTKPASQVDDFMHHLARYDRESHGMYIIDGLRVQALESANGVQAFSIGEGRAHVQGYEVTLYPSKRLLVEEEPSILDAEDEPHTFAPSGDGVMRLNVNHYPIKSIEKIGVTYENTTTITHGSFSGCMDNLPHTSITSIVRVKQGGTTYTQGNDYRLTADKVDWSPTGGEPAPGSSYEITYQYRSVISAEKMDAKGFDIKGVVPGSLVMVNYSYCLPRKDLICLDRDGTVHLIKGVAHRFAPIAPETPPDMLRLATVEQTWDGNPRIKNDAVKAVKMSDMENMRKSITGLYDLNALLQLKIDALASTPAAIHGVFVDPFLDDDMRDIGSVQTGAIVNGLLMLPISGEMASFDSIKGQLTLDYNEEIILEQTWRTGSMKINPYQAFDPMPIHVKLDPTIDRWSYVDTEQKWTSDVTREFFQGQGSSSSTSTRQSVELANVEVNEDPNMRVRDVRVIASNFGPNETFKVFIDSVEAVATKNNADANGNVDTVFTIPAGIPSGARLVELVGTASHGMATYTGLGTISINVMRNVTTRITTFFTPSPPRVDPLAQTFTLSENRHVTSVRFWCTKRGASTIRVQIRETTVGNPNSKIIAESEIYPSQIQENAANTVKFPFPIYLTAGIEYAIVIMTDTSDHELAIAELGEWDENKGQWVVSQPYQGGVLLSSSNASTWTDHQKADMWFQLVGARFTSKTKKIQLGSVTLEDVTEILPLADVMRPATGTDATFVLSKSGVEITRVQAGQHLSLTERLNGEFKVDVELSGSTLSTPILFTGTQIVLGNVQNNGDYITRSFPCGTGKRVSVRVDCITPGSSAVRVYIQTGVSTWTEATADGFEEIGDGWRRMDFSAACSRQETKVKIELSGTPAERPLATSLRAVILDA